MHTSTTSSVSFDPSQLMLIITSGNTINIASSLTWVTDLLTAQTTNPGASLNGEVIYQVPSAQQDATQWKLEFNNQGAA